MAPTDADSDDGTAGDDADEPEGVRVWLVERTFSDDEQNIVILVYATIDGDRYLRKERALTSFDAGPDVTAADLADSANLGAVTDPDERQRYAVEARRMREAHEPDDLV